MSSHHGLFNDVNWLSTFIIPHIFIFEGRESAWVTFVYQEVKVSTMCYLVEELFNLDWKEAN